MAARLRLALAALLLWGGAAAADCVARDFLTLPLPPGDPVEVAVETGFPGSDLDRGAGRFTAPDGTSVAVAAARDVAPAARLDDATFGDQYVQPYPLAFDLTPRLEPWMDPGRVRDEAFFKALFGASAGEVQAELVTVRYPGGVPAAFQVTTRHCVHAQLAAALEEIAGLGHDRFLADPGGSFNWRAIAGTDRLSVHSFGAAVDFNTALGGYWRWSGAAEGAVGAWENRYPESLVRAMERRGFIWGGKWHHFDGMHFEYRPDLILLARLGR